MLIGVVPSADTLPLGEKCSGTKLARGKPPLAAFLGSLSADVFQRSAPGTTHN